jgi:hypothetical protein
MHDSGRKTLFILKRPFCHGLGFILLALAASSNHARIRDYYSIYEKAALPRVAVAKVTRIDGDIATLRIDRALKGRYPTATIRVALRPAHFEQTQYFPKPDEAVLIFQVDDHVPPNGVFPVEYREKGRVILAPASAANNLAVAALLAFDEAKDDNGRVATLAKHYRESTDPEKYMWLNLLIPENRIQNIARLRRELVPILLDDLDRAGSWKIRVNIINKIAMIGSFFRGQATTGARLLKHAKDPSWRVRRQVVDALAGNPHPDVPAAFALFKRDENKLVRERAAAFSAFSSRSFTRPVSKRWPQSLYDQAYATLAAEGLAREAHLKTLKKVAGSFPWTKANLHGGETGAMLFACQTLAGCGDSQGLHWMFENRNAFSAPSFARTVTRLLGQDFGEGSYSFEVKVGAADRAYKWWLAQKETLRFDSTERMWLVPPPATPSKRKSPNKR